MNKLEMAAQIVEGRNKTHFVGVSEYYKDYRRLCQLSLKELIKVYQKEVGVMNTENNTQDKQDDGILSFEDAITSQDSEKQAEAKRT